MTRAGRADRHPPRRRALSGVGPLALTLLACALGCAALLAARWLVSGRPAYPFLAWNLLLAGLPFAFALGALLLQESPARPLLRAPAVAVTLLLWLLFFPNAPYLVSDLTHLPNRAGGAPRWYDAIVFAAFAATGVTSGLASLLIVHGLMARKLGRLAAWAVLATASLLGGYGIYLGRFTRVNSWDALAQPRQILAIAVAPLRAPGEHPRTLVVTALYGSFIFLGYVLMVALLRAGRHLLPGDDG
jgi:uncharacterized membrane protein